MNSSAQPAALNVAAEMRTNGMVSRGEDLVAIEIPVALVYNGISHVVMMASPSDLEDFAYGFSLSENIVQDPADILDCEIVEREQGIELQLRIVGAAFADLKQRRRNLTGRTGCGLCGAESLEQAVPEPPSVNTQFSCSASFLAQAIKNMAERQPLRDVTGSVHAAVFCNDKGELLCLREDVGRHNALDKTIGALARRGIPGAGIMLVTSRASYEMVSKTASAGVPILAAVSAPTSMAITSAQKSGLTLLGHLSGDRQVIYTHGQRIVEDPADDQ